MNQLASDFGNRWACSRANTSRVNYMLAFSKCKQNVWGWVVIGDWWSVQNPCLLTIQIRCVISDWFPSRKETNGSRIDRIIKISWDFSVKFIHSFIGLYINKMSAMGLTFDYIFTWNARNVQVITIKIYLFSWKINNCRKWCKNVEMSL